jgi:hypothetical protein
VNELLRGVKENPEAIATIDVNQDGQIDDLEWDQARQWAVGQVQAEGLPDRVVVAKGGRGDLFMISDRSERELVQRLRWEAAGLIFGGGGAFVAGTAYLARFFGFWF